MLINEQDEMLDYIAKSADKKKGDRRLSIIREAQSSSPEWCRSAKIPCAIMDVEFEEFDDDPDFVLFKKAKLGSQSAEPALVVPITVKGVVVDLTACRLRDRLIAVIDSRFHTLGVESLDKEDEDGPVTLYRDPISFIQNGCDGAVVVSWGSCFLGYSALNLIATASSIHCETKALAERLVEEQSKRFPKIFYAAAPHG